MKSLANALKQIALKLLRTELGSTAGRVNLIGGIILTLLVGAIFIESLAVKILNFVLGLFEKEFLPVISELTMGICVISLVLYFALCVYTISSIEKSRR